MCGHCGCGGEATVGLVGGEADKHNAAHHYEHEHVHPDGQIEGRARCAVCATEFAMSTLYTACPCGSRRFERLQGEELNIKTIELEEAA